MSRKEKECYRRVQDHIATHVRIQTHKYTRSKNAGAVYTGRVDQSATPADALALVQLAFGIQSETSKVFPFGKDRPPFRVRIGLHASPALGGLVGSVMPR